VKDVNLEPLKEWFLSKTEYDYAEIRDDPSATNAKRKTLYVHGVFDWKVLSDFEIPIYLGTAYMSPWVVNEIIEVTNKVGEFYGRT
jgi:hypothetical protein